MLTDIKEQNGSCCFYKKSQFYLTKESLHEMKSTCLIINYCNADRDLQSKQLTCLQAEFLGFSYGPVPELF